ncbi:MAG: HepT-like ribonuclease domain-containing protein [Bacteroidota bacterium]
MEAIEKIFIYTRDIKDEKEFFDKDTQLVFNACQTLLMVIGEESKKLDPELKNKFEHVPWTQISRLRNRIAHDYRSIDPFISFDIIKNHLPELKVALVGMIEHIDFDRELLLKVLKTPHYSHLSYLIED